MYRLWTHAMCPKEGQIDDLIFESIHKEIIDFMYEFYKKQYPGEFYSIEFNKAEDLPF